MLPGLQFRIFFKDCYGAFPGPLQNFPISPEIGDEEIQHAALLGAHQVSGPAQLEIEPVDLPFDNGSLPEGSAQSSGWDVPPNMTLEEIEKLVIEKTLQRTNGNKQAAANLLGIYRPRLYSKIRKYNIDVSQVTSG